MKFGFVWMSVVHIFNQLSLWSAGIILWKEGLNQVIVKCETPMSMPQNTHLGHLEINKQWNMNLATRRFVDMMQDIFSSIC